MHSGTSSDGVSFLALRDRDPFFHDTYSAIVATLYDDFALFIDTCLKVCSRCTNGAQSASNCVFWITFSCVFNTSQIDVLETFAGILEVCRQNLVTQK